MFAESAMRLQTIDCALKPFDVERNAPARETYFDPVNGSANLSVFNDPIYSNKNLNNYADVANARVSRLEKFGNIIDNVQFMHDNSLSSISDLLSENERVVSFLRASRITDAPFSTESIEIIGNICIAMVENIDTKKFSLTFSSAIGSQSISLEEKYKLAAKHGKEKQYYKCFTCQDWCICAVCCRDKADVNSYEDDFNIKYKYNHDFTSQYCTIPFEDCIIDANVHFRSVEGVEASINGSNDIKLESVVKSSCKCLFDCFDCCAGTSNIKALAERLDLSTSCGNDGSNKDDSNKDGSNKDGDKPCCTGSCGCSCCENKSKMQTKDVVFETKLNESMKLGESNHHPSQLASIPGRKNDWVVVKESTIETTIAIHYRSIHDFKIRTCTITLANSKQASSPASRDDLTNAKKFVQLIALNRVLFKRDPISVQKQDYEEHTDDWASFPMSLFGGKKQSYNNVNRKQPQAFIPNVALTVNGIIMKQAYNNANRNRPPNQWADGLCNCCANLFPSCWCASFFCFGQYLLAQISEKVQFKPFKTVMYVFLVIWILAIILMFTVNPNFIVWLPGVCTAIFGATMRVHIANRDKINGCSRDKNCNNCVECCQGFLCVGCSSCQMARHVYGYSEVLLKTSPFHLIPYL